MAMTREELIVDRTCLEVRIAEVTSRIEELKNCAVPETVQAIVDKEIERLDSHLQIDHFRVSELNDLLNGLS